MAERTIYGYCEHKCKEEVYSKSEIDQIESEKQNKVLYGTSTPSDSVGVDGDLFVVLEG